MEEPGYTEDIDFQKYWLILKRHWLPAASVFILVVAMATAAGVLKKRSYEAEGKLLFKKRNTSSALVTDAGAKLGELDALTNTGNPLDTEMELIWSWPIAEKTIKALELKDAEGEPLKPSDLYRNLDVKNIKGTDVLRIKYASRNAEETAAVVNTLMEIYIEQNIAFNRREAAAAREFIKKQLPETKQKLEDAEAELRWFKEENNIVSLEVEAKAAVQVMADLDTILKQTEAALAGAIARSAGLQNQVGLSMPDAMSLNSLSESVAVQQVLSQLQDLENQLAVQRTRYQAKHPIIANLERKQGSLNELLKERIREVLGVEREISSQQLTLSGLQRELIAQFVNAEVERLSLVNRVAALSAERSSYQQRANVMPKLQERLGGLEREVNAAQATYEILSRRLQEVEIAENQNVGNARIIAPAEIPEKAVVGASKKLLIVVGVVAGSMLYVVTAFLFEIIDPSIKTVKEVRQRFGYTLLGLIPKLKKKLVLEINKIEWMVPDLPVRDDPYSVASESYRMLQANLRFLSPDKKLKTIAIASAVSKEGKSTVSANLALAIAQLGRRVLLIDADMRHPVQHHIWDLTNFAGLSQLIVGEAELVEAVVEVTENLDVLPCGIVPPNPLALLDSKRMASLLNDFANAYDIVLMDTPPVVLAADALTVGQMTDGLLLVVRPGIIDTVSAAAAREMLLQSSGVNVLGIAINGVIVENEPDSYFHRARSYHKYKGKANISKKGSKQKTGGKS